MYKDYKLHIWDREGFQGETGWIIQVLGDNGADSILDIVLSDDEANEIGLYEKFDGYDMWSRDLLIRLSLFIDKYDVPRRVYDLLESLPD
jgi:hypothetical protein